MLCENYDCCRINTRMYSKILLVYILLVLDSINSETIFDEDADIRFKDVIPDYLKKYNYELICKLQPNGFNCGSDDDDTEAKFYYDTSMKTCMTFWHGNCDFSLNKFNTLDECSLKCYNTMQSANTVIKNMTANLICRLQPEFGNCQNYLPMFYFDITERLCKGFSYSGCGGNSNRFMTKRMCDEVCLEAVSIPKKTFKDRHDYDNKWEI